MVERHVSEFEQFKKKNFDDKEILLKLGDVHVQACKSQRLAVGGLSLAQAEANQKSVFIRTSKWLCEWCPSLGNNPFNITIHACIDETVARTWTFDPTQSPPQFRGHSSSAFPWDNIVQHGPVINSVHLGGLKNDVTVSRNHYWPRAFRSFGRWIHSTRGIQYNYST